jgi:predicted acetylornithine/succinylornithine family transaminase
MTTQMATNAELKARAERVLMDCYGTREVVLVRGENALVWDADGNEYLDFLQGIASNNLGHCHPAIVEAVKRQAETLMHVSNMHLNQPLIELSEAVCAKTGMTKGVFLNSGAEASETAMKLARLWAHRKFGPHKHTILVFSGAFHGRTYGALTGTWEPKFREGFGPLVPGFRFVKFNDVEDLEKNWDDTVCAVVIEPIQGNGGINVATTEYLQALRAKCTERGACLVIDEVQCGMGRSGRAFAYEYAGIEPDVLVLAKALGGGLAIGACFGRGEFGHVFTPGSHGTTFGGNPLACAAGVAACKELFRDEVNAEVRRLGCLLWGVLERVQKAHPDVIDLIRGLGLMQGVVLRKNVAGIRQHLLNNRLLLAPCANVVLRFLPPVTVSEAQIEEAGRRFEAAIADWKRAGL